MAADPLSAPQDAQAAPDPSQAPGSPQDGSYDASGHPTEEYIAGCLLAAIKFCKDGLAGQADDPDAAQKYGSGAFGFAQAYEKVAGKAAAAPDPVKLMQLNEKGRQADVKSGLTAAKQVDDQAHKDEQLGQVAAKTVLDHSQKQQQAQERARQQEQQQRQSPPVRGGPDNRNSG